MEDRALNEYHCTKDKKLLEVRTLNEYVANTTALRTRCSSQQDIHSLNDTEDSKNEKKKEKQIFVITIIIINQLYIRN